MTTETRAKHTPGPWRAEVGVSPLYRGLVAIIEQSPENFIGIVAEDGEVPQSDWEANARLIATAPELLKAAQKALPLLRGYNILSGDLQADRWGGGYNIPAGDLPADRRGPQVEAEVRAAIAKAIGEQP